MGTVRHVLFLMCGNSIISFYFYLHLLISIHCYILFDLCYIFTCKAQRPLDSDMSRFLGCYTTRSGTGLWCKLKGKHKQGDGFSSSSQVQSNTSSFLCAVIASFPFIFIYTCSFQFIVIFYLIYVMFLLTRHNGLSTAT
jgi:hypothetical protein